MMLILTLWQRKAVRHPTKAGEGWLEDPNEETFRGAVTKLLSSVEPDCEPFQIVAQVGDSSRCVPLGQGWTEERIATELWASYRGLASVNG